jgi:geranylgeranyl diphosphate synthase type I
LSQSLARYRNRIEKELQSFLPEQSQPIYQMMRYQLGWIDESGQPTHFVPPDRLLGSLCLLSADLVAKDYEMVIEAAAAVELTYNFSLVHTDVQDGSPKRNGRSTVWWIWGPAQAINVGNAMHTLARLALFRLTQNGLPADRVVDAVRLLDEAALRLCEGEYLDLVYQERVDIFEHQYLSMAEAKTGALMGCSMQLGALLAGLDYSLSNAFAQCGQKLGMAFQISNDIVSMWGGPEEVNHTPSAEVLNKRKLFPVIYALDKAPIAQKRQLGNAYFKRVMEPTDVENILCVLDSLDARQYSQQKAEHLAGEAVEALRIHDLPENTISRIQEVIENLIQRSS